MDELPLIAAKVRARREQLGLTAEELIARMPEGARMSTSNYREIERGQRTQAQGRTVRALAAALDVSEETVRLWYSGHDTAPEAAPAAGELVSVQEMVDRSIAARLAPLEARLALPEERLSDLDAMVTLLGCLNDDQFRLVATAVAGDSRFSAVPVR
jgi:transcriptional regulator with XRE-family HTH domain